MVKLLSCWRAFPKLTLQLLESLDSAWTPRGRQLILRRLCVRGVFGVKIQCALALQRIAFVGAVYPLE